MKNIKIIGFSLSFFLVLLQVSCEEEVKMIDIFEVSTRNIELNYEGLLESGNSAEFEIGTTKPWRITSHPDWVTLTRTSGGKGRETIILKVDPVGPDNDREGNIVIESGEENHTIAVKQARKTEELVVSPQELQVNIRGALVSSGGEATVYISTNSDWTISSLPAWVNAGNSSGEPGDISVVLTVDMNDTGQTREATFTVTAGALSEEVVIKQDLSYDPITTTTKVVGNQRGEIAEGEELIEVVSLVTWTATGDEWIHLDPSSGDAGTTIVTVSLDPTSEPREGAIVFTDADGLTTEVVVKQEVLFPDDEKPVGHIYLEDDFEWVRTFGGEDELEKTSNNYPGKGASGSTIPIHSNAGANQAFMDKGYEAFNFSGNAFYFGAHYFKMGSTNQQVVLVIPSIPGIEEGKSTNISLSFNATPARGGDGHFDDVILHVLIEGPGSVGINDETTKSEDVDIQLEDDPTMDWPWLERSVVLYGVTSDTKVTIKPSPNTMGGGFNRWLLNDVEFKKHSAVE